VKLINYLLSLLGICISYILLKWVRIIFLCNNLHRIICKYNCYLLISVSFFSPIESTIIDTASLKYPHDPSHALPTSRLEIKQRVLKGPFQPRLKLFSRTKIGNYYRSFQEKWYDKF